MIPTSIPYLMMMRMLRRQIPQGQPTLSQGTAFPGGLHEGKKIWRNPAGEGWQREVGQGPGTRWDELPYETQLNDLRSLTIWGQGGTSEGDSWDPRSIEAARGIVGSDKDVTSDHIQRFKDYMGSSGNWTYMAQHPGKKAFTPELKQSIDWESIQRLAPLLGMIK